MQRPRPRDLSDAVHLRGELVRDGYTDQQLRAFVRSGIFHRVRHGAYVDGAFWRSLSEADRHRVRCRAVLRTAHPLTALSHVSAAVERGVPVWGVDLADVHTTRTDGKGGRREAGVVHHRGFLREQDVEVINDVRVTGAARCAAEVCAVTTVEPALVIVNGLLHAGAMTLREFAEEVKDTKHWPETISSNLVVRLADDRMESVAETRTDFLCWSQHLPRPEPQVGIVDERGHQFARVDFAWPEQGVFLEFDGRIKYERFRRGSESLEDFLMREKRREERICQLTGWVCIRITWADLEDPVATARRIRRVLESRQHVGA